MSGISKQVSQARSAIPGLGDPAARRTVFVCVFLCAIAAGAWAYMNPGNWTASQSLVVRDDLLGDSFKPGRFNSLESMKAAQETIFHIARKPEVIRAAIRECGRSNEISNEEIEQYQRFISIVAPNGGEFGKTEVFVLRVREKSVEQAEFLIESLTSEIESHLQIVRTSLMASMQAELASNVARTSEHYADLVKEIQKVEESVGADLGSLRGLIDPNSGAGDLQRSLEQIRLEIRSAENDRERVARQLDLVRLAMQQSSGEYLTTSNDLLELQPVLKRLNDGLIDSRLSLSLAMGKYDSGHPLVENAKTAASQTLDQIRSVLDSTEQGLVSQLAMYEQKVARLFEAEKVCANRLIEIGKLRVTYKSLSDELTKRGDSLAKTRTELAEIQALAESAEEVSLITRVGEPQTGTRPDGISKRAMVFAGMLGGLMIGIGLVVLRGGPNTISAEKRTADSFTKTEKPNAMGTDEKIVPARNSPGPMPKPGQLKPEKHDDSLKKAAVEQPVKTAMAELKTLVAAKPLELKPSIARPVEVKPADAKPVVAKTVQGLSDGTPPVTTPPATPAKAFVTGGITEPLQSVSRPAAPQALSPSQPKVLPPVPVKPAASKPPEKTVEKKSQAPAVESSPPAVRAGMMVPNPTGRPGHILKTADLVGDSSHRQARSDTANSTSSAGSLTSADIDGLVPPTPTTTTSKSAAKSEQGPDDGSMSTGVTTRLNENKSVVQSVSSGKTVRSTDLEHNQTVSLENLQIQLIRKQLEELDPNMSFDVFCEAVRKEEPPKNQDA